MTSHTPIIPTLRKYTRAPRLTVTHFTAFTSARRPWENFNFFLLGALQVRHFLKLEFFYSLGSGRGGSRCQSVGRATTVVKNYSAVPQKSLSSVRFERWVGK